MQLLRTTQLEIVRYINVDNVLELRDDLSPLASPSGYSFYRPSSPTQTLGSAPTRPSSRVSGVAPM